MSQATAAGLDEAELLEAGRLLFARPCDFVAGAPNEAALPPMNLPEIAFAGRSNVGKSSLVNALTGRKTLARVSNTPGRTQQLNFFDLGRALTLVDMPGYGYAAVSRSKIDAWTDLVGKFLAGRASLLRIYLLVDSRHGLKPTDIEQMQAFDRAAASFAVVLTKADALKPGARAERLDEVERQTRSHPAAFPQVVMTSAETGLGIPELRAGIARLLVERGNPL